MGTVGITTSNGRIIPNSPDGGDGPETFYGGSPGSQGAFTWGGQPVKTDATGNPSFLTENLGKDNKLPWQQYYDPSVVDTNNPNSLLSRSLSRNSDYYKNANNYGVNDNVNFQATPLTGAGNSMGDAIARKYQRTVASKVGAVSSQNEQDALSRDQKNQGQATSVLAAAQKKSNDNFLEQYEFQVKRQNLNAQYRAQKEAANSSFIGNILGIATGVATLGMGK